MIIQVILTVCEVLFIVAALITFASGNSSFLYFFIFAFVMIIVKRLLSYEEKSINNNQGQQKVREETIQELVQDTPHITSKDTNANYSLKPFLTSYELDFYNKIYELNRNFIVVPQVNLSSIIDKQNASYCNELFRNISFGIFNKNFELLLLIEIDNKTPGTKNPDEDSKINEILNKCKIKMLTFNTYYANEKDYVLKEIINNLY